MSSTAPLTQGEVEQEKAWLANFNQALDSLDVLGRWAPFWAQDSFVQFANDPKIHKKEMVLRQLAELFGYFSSVRHSTIRVTLDREAGLIYHTASVSMQVKGDSNERIFTVPSLTILHKKVREEKITGMEVYIDIGPAKEVLVELARSK